MTITRINSEVGVFGYALCYCKGLCRFVTPFRSATPEREPAQTFEGELLAHYADQPLIQPVGVVVTIGTIAALAAYHVNPLWPLAWVALKIGFHICYGYILPRLVTTDTEKQKRNLKIYCCLTAISGAIYGLSIGFFPYFSLIEQFITAVIIAALCTGAVTALAGYTLALNLYAGIALVAIAFGLVFMPARAISATLPNWIDDAFAFLILIYLTVILGHGRQVLRIFRDSFEIRLRQVSLNRELQTALKEAEAANRAKTRFLASASHDLRQPIHTLSLFNAALSMREMDPECREIVDNMETALSTLAVQLDTLLDISRLDAGVITPELKVFDIQPILERLYREYLPLCDNKALDIQLDACEPAFVQSDPALLARILGNLLSNAVRYSDCGSIRIALRKDPGTHIIAISDTGRGIPQAEQNRIFEEFYQLDNPERDRTKGLGLGLPIVHRLTSMLAIDLNMTSTPSKGTTFELRLSAVEGAPVANAVPQPAAGEGATTSANILVIDDEAGIRRGMKTFLRDLGYNVTLADSTERAVKQAQLAPPDIVLADLRLRGSDNGIKAIQSIRAVYPHIRAVLISGDTAPDRLREAHDAGIKLVHKPVSPEHLRELMSKLNRPAI